MSDKEKRILETFGSVLPDLSESEKEKLLSYGEGYAAGVRSRSNTELERQQLKTQETG